MPVDANTDITALTVSQINSLLDDAGSPVVVDEATYLSMNASNEAQYEVLYQSTQANAYVKNHVFVDLDLQGDVRATINDLVEEDDPFAE